MNLYLFLLKNHFDVLEAAMDVMVDKLNYDLMDATDYVASDVYNYWCEYVSK